MKHEEENKEKGEENINSIFTDVTTSNLTSSIQNKLTFLLGLYDVISLP
jgi:hypothetical protein